MEDYYFENLHVLKDGDKYESFIVRYFPEDKTKKFELNQFTGRMQFFDYAKKLRSTLYFENGNVKRVEAAPTNSITGKLPDQIEDNDDGCGCRGGGGSLLSQFFSWIGGLFSNIHISFGSGDYYSGGDYYAGDYFLSISPPNGGGDYYLGHGNSYYGNSSSGTSSNPVVFVPTQAQSEYHRMQVRDIVRKLGTTDSIVLLWMMDYNNIENVNNIYYFLNKFENTPETLDFFREAVFALKDGGGVDYGFRIIEDKSFTENPCLSGVYSKLGEGSKFDSYLKKFDGDFSVANLMLSAVKDSNYPKANAVTYSPVDYLIEIKFNPENLHRPALDIARTFIHELIHAEIYRKLLSCSRLPHVNVGKMTDSQWQIYIYNLKNDFPGLFEYYMRYKYNVPPNQQISDPHHELMAQHYRQIVVQVLKQYDGNAHSDEFYNALAWIGLMGEGELPIDSPTGLPPVPTVVWKNVPQSQRLQILSIYKNFLNTNAPCQ